MNDEHEHEHQPESKHEHEHEHEHGATPASPAPGGPVTPDESVEDAGSRALAEALRSSFTIVKLVMWVLVIVFVCSGFFVVGPQEKAVILRFGRPVGVGEAALRGPGLHWSFPYPIDEVVRIPITQLQYVTSDVGWYHVTPEQQLSGKLPPPGPSLNPAVDGYLITGDADIIHSRVRLYYRIEDPIAFEFNFMNASNAVLSDLDNAMIHAAAHFKVDDILYRELGRFNDEVQRRVTDLINQQHLGVYVDHCELLDNIPPRQVKAAFERVNTAREDRSRLLEHAHSDANQKLIAAGAQAASITNAAEADKTILVKSVSGDAKFFNSVLPKYEKNPDLFKQVYLVNAMREVMTNLNERIYMPNRMDGKRRELRLLLNREPPKAITGTTNQP